ncbi:hypothetical protein QJS04_geneDACA008647 [Acorus gramineus]|uniref:Uncharacterized protein n=1 Tax=Acorus gramineus TaxID=55184 RepID=A0AAV9AGB2_ACOGR|nr:hypothetical protein QJS04_geneDACA008647 [Acorus gramineus]
MITPSVADNSGSPCASSTTTTSSSSVPGSLCSSSAAFIGISSVRVPGTLDFAVSALHSSEVVIWVMVTSASPPLFSSGTTISIAKVTCISSSEGSTVASTGISVTTSF